MRNSIFKLVIVALSLGLSACAGQLMVEEPLEVSAPDLDALNAMSSQAASEDPEELAAERQARRQAMADLRSAYEAAPDDQQKAVFLKQLARVTREWAFDLRAEAEANYHAANFSYRIGETNVAPQLKLDAYNEALLKLANVLRDITGNYPKDPLHTEHVLQLANTMALLGNEHCEHYFKAAARQASDPKLVAKVKLARADWLASQGKWKEAIALYTAAHQQVKKLAGDSESSEELRAYTVYRLGWAFLEQGNKKKAEAAFKLVYLSEPTDSARRLDVHREAALSLADLWARERREEDARKFAEEQSAPEFMQDYQEFVAQDLQRTGKFDELVAFRNEMIKQQPLDVKVPDYRLEMAQAELSRGKVQQFEAQIQALRDLTENPKDPWFEKYGEQELLQAHVRKMITNLPRAAGYKMLQMGLAEKNSAKQKSQLTVAIKLIQDLVKQTSDQREQRALRLALTQAYSVLQRPADALDQYDAIIAAHSGEGEPAVSDLAFERLKLVLQLDEAQQYPELPAAGQVPKPLPLPPLKERFAAAAQHYLKLVPDAENVVELRYRIAQDLFSYGHYAKALPQFEQLANDFPRAELGKAGMEIAVSMYAQQQNFDEVVRLTTSLLNNRKVKGNKLRIFLKEALDWAKEQRSLAH